MSVQTPPLEKRVVEHLLDRLVDHGVTHLFLVPGAHIDPLVEALAAQTAIRPIVCATEAGAGFMADGYARVSGRCGVVAAIGGPGAANLIPSANICRLEQSRVLFLTGNVPQDARGAGAFQDGYAEGARDADLFATAAGESHSLRSPEEFSRTIDVLLERLRRGVGRPIHLSIPYDLQVKQVRSAGGRLRATDSADEVETDAIDSLPQLVRELKALETRVVIVAGRGAGRSPNLPGLLQTFAERFQIPVATTLDAKGVIPESHSLSLGTFGFAGTELSYRVLCDEPLDAVLWFGCELNERNTLCWDSRLLHPARRHLHVDSCSGPAPHTSNITHYEIPIETALEGLLAVPKAELGSLAATIADRSAQRQGLWNSAWMRAEPDGWSLESPIHPGQVVSAMRERLPASTRLCVDAGAHRQFASRYWRAESTDHFLTSASIASMGWAIAAGIGAKLADPSRPVAVFTGDGCMQMHGMELTTAVRYQIPVSFVVSNNSALGNVYVRQNSRSQAAAGLSRLGTVDWAGVARSCGATGVNVRRLSELSGALTAPETMTGPVVVDVTTQADAPFPGRHLVPTCCTLTNSELEPSRLRAAA
ncbi:MAG: thiamine pyrophosphate-binding protein [Planctomycetaceae bacterium]|nr:thiamine pyrophosphate-binding protein [Planctomycetaceae bacterium]